MRYINIYATELCSFLFYISDQIRGKEQMWVIGDDFVAKNIDHQLFRKSEASASERYALNNYEVYYTANRNFGAINKNTLARLRNCLIQLINRHATLPKFIIIFVEADIIEYLNTSGPGVTCAYGEALDWLVAEFRKTIISFKNIMPNKAKVVDQPHIVWIQTTRHNNYANDELRDKFNKCLDTIVRLQENSSIYDLRQLWDSRSNNLVLPHNGRLTYEGLRAIWAGLDRTIKYAVVKYQNNIDKAKIAVYLQQRSLQRSLNTDRRDRGENHRHERHERRRSPDLRDNRETSQRRRSHSSERRHY